MHDSLTIVVRVNAVFISELLGGKFPQITVTPKIMSDPGKQL